MVPRRERAQHAYDQRLREAAMFSYLVYDGHSSSKVRGATSSVRYRCVLNDVNVQNVIGSGWTVLHSSQDAAIFVNKAEHRAYLSVRGSDFANETYRDVLLNDIGGFFGIAGRRVDTTMVDMLPHLQTLVEHGYDVSATGHSLGGSVALAIADKIAIKVYTFNAPELDHGAHPNMHSRVQHMEQGLQVHVVIENDVVSKIGIRSRSERATIVLDADGKGFIEAHKMVTVLEHICPNFPGLAKMSLMCSPAQQRCQVDDSLFALGDSSDSSDPAAARRAQPITRAIKVHLRDPKVKFKFEKTSSESNIFYTFDEYTLTVYDGEGGVMGQETIGDMKLTSHSAAAVDAMTNALLHSTVNYITCPRDGRPGFMRVVRDTGVAGATAFTGSVISAEITSRIGNALVGGTLGNGISEALVQIARGDTKGAAIIASSTGATAVLQQATELPITVRLKTSSATFGSLVGRHETTLRTRDEVVIPLGKIVIGCFQGSFRTERALRSGQTLVRTGHEQGGMIRDPLGFAEVSLGLQSGHESVDPLSTLSADGIRTTFWWTRDFKAQLTLSVSVAGRGNSFSILPAFSSHKVSYTQREREDGSPLYSRTDLAPRHERQEACDKPGFNSKEVAKVADLQPTAHSHKPGSSSSSSNSVQKQAEIATEHDSASSACIESLVDVETGRREDVLRTTKEDHVKKSWWGLKKKRWTDRYEQGLARETTTSTSAGIEESQEYGSEYVTMASNETDTFEFTTRNGSRQSEVHMSNETNTAQLYSRYDGRDYRSSHATMTLADGSHVTHEEHVRHHLHVESQLDSMRTLPGDTVVGSREELDVGTYTTESRGVATKEVVERGVTRSTQVTTIEQASFEDTRARSEQQYSGETTTTQHEAGEKRQCSGIESKVEQTTQRSRGRGLSTFTTAVETRTVVKRTEFTASREGQEEILSQANKEYGDVVETATSVERRKNNGFVRTTNVFVEAEDGTLSLDTADGKVATRRDLSIGSSRALTTAVTQALDLLMSLVRRKREGEKIDKKEIGVACSRICVDAGEGFLVGLAGDIVEVTKQVGDGVLLAFIAMGAAFLAKRGINWYAKKASNSSAKAGDGEDGAEINSMDENGSGAGFMPLQPSSKTNAAIQTAGDAARNLLQILSVAVDLGFSSAQLFGIGQLIAALQTVAITLNVEGLSTTSLWQAVSLCAPQFLGGLVSTLSAAGTELVIGGAFVGTVLASGALSTSAFTVIATAAVAYAALRLFQGFWAKYVVGCPERRELERLLARYHLKKQPTVREVTKAYRKQCLYCHPDRHGGSCAKFQRLQKDFTRLIELQEKYMMSKRNQQKSSKQQQQQQQTERDVQERTLFQSWCRQFRKILFVYSQKIFSREDIYKHLDMLGTSPALAAA